MEELSKMFSGKCYISGIDRETKEIDRYGGKEDCEVTTFTLNGKTVVVSENPSDGYRSYAEWSSGLTGDVKNAFEPKEVFCLHIGRSGYRGDTCDILEVRSMKDGSVVLEIGTSNIDDYYPSYVSNFSAENLSK